MFTEQFDPLLRSLFFPEMDDDSELCKSIFSDGSNKIDDGLQNPVGEFFRKAERSLNKLDGRDWNEEIGAAPRITLSKDVLERSDARLERAAIKIRTMFGDHKEEAEEAVRIAEQMLEDTREEILGA